MQSYTTSYNVIYKISVRQAVVNRVHQLYKVDATTRKKYHWNPAGTCVTSHGGFGPRKIHALLCYNRDVFFHNTAYISYFILNYKQKSSFCYQLERMLNNFNFLSITIYLRNGVSSTDGQILTMFTLLQSAPCISVINNYAEPCNLNY